MIDAFVKVISQVLFFFECFYFFLASRFVFEKVCDLKISSFFSCISPLLQYTHIWKSTNHDKSKHNVRPMDSKWQYMKYEERKRMAARKRNKKEISMKKFLYMSALLYNQYTWIEREGYVGTNSIAITTVTTACEHHWVEWAMKERARSSYTMQNDFNRMN